MTEPGDGPARCTALHPEYHFTCPYLPDGHGGPHFDPAGGHWSDAGQVEAWLPTETALAVTMLGGRPLTPEDEVELTAVERITYRRAYTVAELTDILSCTAVELPEMLFEDGALDGRLEELIQDRSDVHPVLYRAALVPERFRTRSARP